MKSKNQQSKQENQHGQQNQEPKKGQNPNDPLNKHFQKSRDNSQKLGPKVSKEGRQP